MISIAESRCLKSIAIFMMLFLHLFNNLNFQGLFSPLIFVGDKPLVYYISLFCDSCVPIFAFVSGYGIYYKYNTKSFGFLDRLKSLKWLYINLWVIILIFPILIGFVFKPDEYPGRLSDILGNISGLNMTYNGAWWYFTTYVLFVLTCDFWFKLMNRFNNQIFLFSIFLVIYIIAFYFRIYKTNLFDSKLLNVVQVTVSLYFCTLFQFMLGAMTLKFEWRTKLSSLIIKLPYKDLILILAILCLIFIHALIPNFIIEPFIGLAFIIIFLNLNILKRIQSFILFFTAHSTNIWLVHMFFYSIFFKQFIYGFKYVIPIYTVLILCCLFSSYIINWMLSRLRYHIK